MTANRDKSPGKLSYIPEFDGLRALSVFLVITVHCMRTTIPGGYIGVDIFFVLSGYLITRILLDEYDATHKISFKNFYARRCLRLMPALWLLLLTLVAFSVAAGGPDERNHLLAALSAGFYFMNFTKSLDIGPSDIVSHTWSLAMEEQFYIVWPLMLLLILKKIQPRFRWMPIFLALLTSAAWRGFLVFSGATVERVYFGIDTRAETILYGCLLAVMPRNQLWLFAKRFWFVPIAFLAIYLLVPLNVSDGAAALSWWPTYTIGLSAVDIGAMWAILLILDYRSATKIPLLGWAPIVYLGRISYGIYLWHYPVSIFTGTKLQEGFAKFLVTITITIAVASASFYFVETPALKLKKFFRSKNAGFELRSQHL